jgi:hypothetical protein
MTSRFPNAPVNVQRLPVDERGFPVPWFVAWENGKPDFQYVRPERAEQAHRRRVCWICGKPMGRMKCFVIGPMCAVNRVSSEPPSHPQCARFAAESCPFLSKPMAKRLPRREGVAEPPGLMITRNPGVTLVWRCLRYSMFFVNDPDGQRAGVLFNIGDPVETSWFREGRPATREEVVESIHTGLPSLVGAATAEGPDALIDLQERVTRTLPLLPRFEEAA